MCMSLSESEAHCGTQHQAPAHLHTPWNHGRPRPGWPHTPQSLLGGGCSLRSSVLFKPCWVGDMASGPLIWASGLQPGLRSPRPSTRAQGHEGMKLRWLLALALYSTGYSLDSFVLLSCIFPCPIKTILKEVSGLTSSPSMPPGDLSMGLGHVLSIGKVFSSQRWSLWLIKLPIPILCLLKSSAAYGWSKISPWNTVFMQLPGQWNLLMGVGG